METENHKFNLKETIQHLKIPNNCNVGEKSKKWNKYDLIKGIVIKWIIIYKLLICQTCVIDYFLYHEKLLSIK